MNTDTSPYMPESEGKVLCIQIERPILAENYKGEYLPRVQKICNEFGELRILLYFKKFQGWEKEAAAMDLAATPQVYPYLSKLALVNPPPSFMALTELRKNIKELDTRVFAEADLQEALSWIKA